MNSNQKIVVELIIVLVLVVFALWSLKQDSDSKKPALDGSGAAAQKQ